MKKLLILFVASGFVIACNPKTAEIVEEKQDGFPTEKIGEGQALFVSKCAKCHDLPVVDNYSKERWGKILPAMAVKAKLTDEESAKVEAYVNWELEN